MLRRVINLLVFAVVLISAAVGCAAPQAGISRAGYAIQVGAFSEVKNAERLTAQLQVRGIEAFYFRRDNGFYAVRFGDFSSKEAARKSAQKLVSDRLIGAFFIAPPQDVAFGKQTVVKKAPEPSLKRPDSARKKQAGSRESGPDKAGKDMGYIAARTAERFVGIPYRWGGDTVVEGMDCSGFARAVYNLCGVNIPRTSREQFRVGESVSKGELKDGDLVFFGATEENINHVGIYVGDGKFVHAPRRGDDIKVSSLDESNFARKFMGGRRYFQ